MAPRTAIAILSALPALLAAPPAFAQRHYYCSLQDEAGGIRATLTQTYFEANRPLGQPIQQVSASVDGVFISAGSWPRWRSLDAPFEAPRRIHVGIRLPERAASRRVSLFAPGAAPIRLKVRIYGPQANEIGIGFALRGRARIAALLTHRDWTVLVHHPDGRVQQIVPVRMPLSLDRLRALRESQAARMRAYARDPGRHCLLGEDESAIVSR